MAVFSALALAVLVGPMFGEYPLSWDELLRGKVPGAVTRTLWAALGGAYLLVLLLWVAIAVVFRRCVVAPSLPMLPRCLGGVHALVRALAFDEHYTSTGNRHAGCC